MTAAKKVEVCVCVYVITIMKVKKACQAMWRSCHCVNPFNILLSFLPTWRLYEHLSLEKVVPFHTNVLWCNCAVIYCFWYELGKTWTYDVAVFVCVPISSFERADQFSRNLVWTLCHWRPPQRRTYLEVTDNNMADAQIFGGRSAGAILSPLSCACYKISEK
jgi:hypothetical protein